MQGKLLYQVLQDVGELCESWGGGITRVWSPIPHEGKDALYGNAMASMMKTVTSGWLHGLLRKERPELTRALSAGRLLLPPPLSGRGSWSQAAWGPVLPAEPWDISSELHCLPGVVKN